MVTYSNNDYLGKQLKGLYYIGSHWCVGMSSWRSISGVHLKCIKIYFIHREVFKINHAIVTATHKKLSNPVPVFQPIASKTKTVQSHLVRLIFPKLCYRYLLEILTGSLCSLLLLWFVKMITLGLVLRQSLDNHSITASAKSCQLLHKSSL